MIFTRLNPIKSQYFFPPYKTSVIIKMYVPQAHISGYFMTSPSNGFPLTDTPNQVQSYLNYRRNSAMAGHFNRASRFRMNRTYNFVCWRTTPKCSSVLACRKRVRSCPSKRKQNGVWPSHAFVRRINAVERLERKLDCR